MDRQRSPDQVSGLAPRALPAEARWHNRSLVLESLLRDGPLSRADLARRIGLTRPAISSIVAGLLASGSVREIGRRQGQVGKPSTLLAIVPESQSVVCLDLGAEHEVRGALVDLAGEVVAEQSVTRRRFTGEAARRRTRDLVGDLVGASGAPVLGVGIGAPGVIDTTGRVVDSPNLGWSDVDLRSDVAGDVGVPVYVANDANLATLSEHAFAGSPASNLLVVKFGFGLGAGLVLDGALVPGDHHSAGEIGHVAVDPRGPRCACGRRGCLEAVLAPLLREAAGGGTGTGPDAIRKGALCLGSALAPVVAALDVGTVAISAPTDLLGDGFPEGVANAIRSRVIDAIGVDLHVRYTAHGDRDVLLGAAAIVVAGELGVRRVAPAREPEPVR